MPRLRRLAGAEIVRTLGQFGFTVPAHSELDTGTCRAIFRQAARFVADEDLRPHFYSD